MMKVMLTCFGNDSNDRECILTSCNSETVTPLPTSPTYQTCSECAVVDKELVAAPGHNSSAHIFSLAYSHIHMVVSNKW
jgi:hypothetical protein